MSHIMILLLKKLSLRAYFYKFIWVKSESLQHIPNPHLIALICTLKRNMLRLSCSPPISQTYEQHTHPQNQLNFKVLFSFSLFHAFENSTLPQGHTLYTQIVVCTPPSMCMCVCAIKNI